MRFKKALGDHSGWFEVFTLDASFYLFIFVACLTM
jgi:hypothetical protein